MILSLLHRSARALAHGHRWLLLAAGLSLGTSALAQTAPQTLTLAAGWNAVWLEVEPTYDAGTPKAGQAKSPEDVFGATAAIEIIATPKVLASSAEFFAADPAALPATAAATTFNQDEWQQWKRNDTAGTNNLSMIFGNRPYLIRTTGTAQVTLALTGKVRFARPKWTADRYNLIGFGLEGTRTIAQFFDPAGPTHPVDKIFTLNPNGAWAKVTPATAMVSNRAYWIFANGPSTYMGPTALDFGGASVGSLDFGGPGDAVKVGAESFDLRELTLTNVAGTNATPSVTGLSVDPTLALFRVTPATDNLGYVRGNGFLAAFFPVLPQTTATLTIGARRTFTDDALHTSLYRVRTSAIGASFYLPITAVRSDLTIVSTTTGAPASSTVTGLWIGDVKIDRSTSIVVNGAPVQPSSGSVPMRLVLHSDANGVVRLLSQVTMMETKTADASVAPAPVLVVDPTKVPFFEGIKTRNGKRVGVRIESVSYDMPRSASAWSGADLASFATRPVNLQEIYDLAVPMSGSLGGSITGTFVLDPFHRSNPLRHVYHQDLPKGPKITRTMALSFTSDTSDPDKLTGSFTETIDGVIKDRLTLQGSVELRRVSNVATLQGQ